MMMFFGSFSPSQDMMIPKLTGNHYLFEKLLTLTTWIPLTPMLIFALLLTLMTWPVTATEINLRVVTPLIKVWFSIRCVLHVMSVENKEKINIGVNGVHVMSVENKAKINIGVNGVIVVSVQNKAKINIGVNRDHVMGSIELMSWTVKTHPFPLIYNVHSYKKLKRCKNKKKDQRHTFILYLFLMLWDARKPP